MCQHIHNINRKKDENSEQNGGLVRSNRLINRTTLRIGDHSSNEMEETLQLKFVPCESINSPHSEKDNNEMEGLSGIFNDDE